MTRHNLRVTRQFISAARTRGTSDTGFRAKYLDGTATYLPFVPGQWDPGFLSHSCVSVTTGYRVEYYAERFRSMLYPLAPSPLSVTYAFGDYESCVEASRRHHWDINSVRRFRLEHDALTRVQKCNMEIVSLARQAYLVSSVAEREDRTLWGSYWSGARSIQMELPDENLQPRICQSGELWEYLIEGRLVLADGEPSIS